MAAGAIASENYRFRYSEIKEMNGMEIIKSRTEIAQALNFGKYPVLKIDLSECDEHGLNGSKCRIDMGTFNDGTRWLEPAQINVYRDEKVLHFSAWGCCLSKDFTYHDFEEDLENSMTPIIKAESEFIVAVLDSKYREVYALYKVETGHTIRHCTKPISCEKVDMSQFIEIARLRYERWS